MFNLLRMDLYRAKRSKSVYICFGILFLATVMLFGLIWLMVTPQGQETSLRIGMISQEEAKEASGLLNGVDSLIFFRQICLDGGAYDLIFGIWVMLFVCMDFQSGFIKNVMALHQNRWNYVVSKILTAGIVNACYLVLHYLSALLMNRIFGELVPYTKWVEVVFYLSWAWLLTTAFAALTIMVCVLTRSVAAGAVATVLFSSGIIVMPLYGILDMFHIGGWMEHTIYLTLAMGPRHYTSIKDLHVYAAGLGFLILYTGITGMILKRQDI